MVCDELGGREPNEVELAMFSLLWSEHCAYKHSKKLLRTLPTEGPAVVMGPGENAGAVDVGDGWAVAFKVESHNHPQRRRAVPGRGHRRRRHPARHLRARRAADRRARLAALRRADSRALALPARPRGRRHRPLRQLDRRADRRRRGLLRGALRDQLPGQRDGPRPGADRRHGPQRRRRRRQRRWSCSAPRPAATASAARRCWRRPSSTPTTSPSARRCRSATRSRRPSCWSARSSCWTAGCSSRCRTSARRA